MKTFISDISGKEFGIDEVVLAKTLRKSIFDCVLKDYPSFQENSKISIEELNYYRQKYISERLINEVGELNDLKVQVIESIKKTELISNESIKEPLKNESLGNRIADKVADFGGSWTFILSFIGFLLIWIGINAFVFFKQGL